MRASALEDPAVEHAASARRRRYSAPLVLTLLGVALLGFNDVRIAGQPVADIVFLAATGTTMLVLLAGGGRNLAPARMRRAPNLMVIGILIVLTMGMFTSTQAIDVAASLGELLRFGWVTLVWFWLLRAVTPDLPALLMLIRAFKVTVMANAVAALLGTIGLLDLNAGEFFGSRQTAFYSHPNLLGVLLAVGLPFFVVEMPVVDPTAPRQAPWKRFALAAVVVGAIGSTGSMASFLGATAGFAVAFAVSRAVRPRRRSRIHPLAVMGLSVLALLGVIWLVQSDSPVVERFTLFQSGNSAVNVSVDSRAEFNRFAINRLDDSMILGVGLDNESSLYYSELDIGLNHNMFLSTLYRAGLPALLGLVLVLFAAVRQAVALVRATRTSPMHGLATAVLAAVVSACLIAMSQPTTNERSFWFTVGIIPVVAAVFRQRVLLPGRDLEAGLDRRSDDVVTLDDVPAARLR